MSEVRLAPVKVKSPSHEIDGFPRLVMVKLPEQPMAVSMFRVDGPVGKNGMEGAGGVSAVPQLPMTQSVAAFAVLAREMLKVAARQKARADLS